ncbi:MAG: NAD(+) diphosphatase [Rhodospirillales bacterium]
MTDTTANFYAGAGLDRVDKLRRDQAWIEARLRDPETRFLPVWQGRNLVADPERPGLAWLGADEARHYLDQGAAWALLGVMGGACYVALDVSAEAQPDHAPLLVGRGHFSDLRVVGQLMPRDEGALLAYARGLVYWHGRHRYCGLCGGETQLVQGGHVRRCSRESCGTQHFPRTDPAVIMLIHDGGDRCVMGRQKIWPPGMHSTLAGFLEPGESLEETVVREVEEEVGLKVREVTYHSSQPWPFPSSLMVGFHTRADFGALTVDPDELESAAWFDRAQLLASPEDDTLRLPRRDSIARRLINDWLAEG